MPVAVRERAAGSQGAARGVWRGRGCGGVGGVAGPVGALPPNHPSCGVGRAWETWTVNTGPVVRDVHGVGEVEQRRDVTQVALPYVSFRYSYRFSKDALAVTSDSTLRFRSRDEIERSLNDAGFNILDIRDAPDRPRQEYVFITELTSD